YAPRRGGVWESRAQKFHRDFRASFCRLAPSWRASFSLQHFEFGIGIAQLRAVSSARACVQLTEHRKIQRMRFPLRHISARIRHNPKNNRARWARFLASRLHFPIANRLAALL